MQTEEFDIQLSGADRTRVILPNRKTSATSDYLIRTNNGYEITMELVNDYTGFWYRNHKLHLRDNKYLQLQRNHSLLLAIALSPNVQNILSLISDKTFLQRKFLHIVHTAVNLHMNCLLKKMFI